MIYEGIKYGTKVLVTSGFYEGQEVIVESWRNAHGPCTRRDLHDTRNCTNASTSSRDYFVRFSNGMARWISCDVLSADAPMKSPHAPRVYMGEDTYNKLSRAGKENDELRGKFEVIAKLYRELDMKYIDATKEIESMKKSIPNPGYVSALERVYTRAAVLRDTYGFSVQHAGKWAELTSAMRTARDYRP